MSIFIFKYTIQTSQNWPVDDSIVHFTIVRSVTWPMNESEAGVDLVLIEASLLFLCKFLLISMTTTSLT